MAHRAPYDAGRMLVQIVHPDTSKPFPSVVANGRRCYAVPEGARFAVLSDAGGTGRHEYVVAVDGRDTQTNQDARPDLRGVVASGTYTCKGFQVDQHGVREFVAAATGYGAATAERAGTPSSAGLVAVAAYPERGRYVRREPHVRRDVVEATLSVLRSPYVGDVPQQMGGVVGIATGGTMFCNAGGASSGTYTTRGPVTRGASVGAAAGTYIKAEIGETRFERADTGEIEVVEYDTPTSWAARGVLFPVLGGGSPWPGTVRKFAAAEGL